VGLDDLGKVAAEVGIVEDIGPVVDAEGTAHCKVADLVGHKEPVEEDKVNGLVAEDMGSLLGGRNEDQT